MTGFRFKNIARVSALAVVITLVAAACELSDWDVGGQHRPWWCDPTDTEINDGHGSGHGHHSPYTEEKGPLTAEQCLALDVQFNAAAEFAALFPTKSIAEANGFHWLAPWIPGQGTHHVSEDPGITTSFDSMVPTMLMYDGNGPNAPLTGMVWTVDSGDHPPEGFAGDNDHWHFHETLCIVDGPFIVGDGISDAACSNLGGINTDTSNIWLVHVWLPVYDGWLATDIFNKEHPGIN